MTEPELKFSQLQHEAGDRTQVVAEHFATFVAQHPFVQCHVELAGKADAIETALAELYQCIFSEEPE